MIEKLKIRFCYTSRLKKYDIHDTIIVNKADGLHQHNMGIKYFTRVNKY